MPRRTSLHIPEDFLELIPPGGFVLFTLPDAYVAKRFVPAFLAQAKKSSKLTLFGPAAAVAPAAPHASAVPSAPAALAPALTPAPAVSPASVATPALAALPAFTTVPFDAFRSSSDCQKALAAAGKKRGAAVVLDLSTETPGWLSSTDSRERFLRGAAEALRNSRTRSLLLLTENLLEPAHWGKLKRDASAIVVLRPTGDELYCQLIAAAGVYDSEQFLPRLVRIQDGEISWGKPLVPAPDGGTPDERVERLKDKLRRAESSQEHRFEQSVYPQAIMSPRRILSVNAAFRAAMPWSVDEGGEPLVTPHQLFGRKNSHLLQDVFASGGDDVPATDPAATPLEPRAGSASGIAAPLIRDVAIPVKDSAPIEFELSVLPLPSDDRSLVLCTFVPTGPRQKALHDLQASDAYLRSVLAASAGAVMVVRDGNIVFASQGFLSLFGFLLIEDIVGSEVSRIAAGRDRKAIVEHLAAVAEKDTPASFDFVGATKEGGRLHLSASASEVVLEGRKSIVCYLFDRSAEVAARAERERRHWEAETLQKLMIVIRDPDRYVDLAGASLDYLIKRLGADGGAVYEPREGGVHLVTSRELSEKVRETLATMSQTDGLGGFVSRTLEPLVLSLASYPPHIPHKNLFEGEGYNSLIFIPLYSQSSLQGLIFLCSRRPFDADASSIELLTGVADQLGSAASRVHTLDRVRASEAMFRSAVETVKDLVYQTLPNGVFRLIGPQVVGLCGYQPGEITRGPDNWRNIVHPDDRLEYSRRITAGAQGNEGIELEYRILPKGKAAYRWVRDSVRYLRAPDGTVESINGIISDITEHIELERRLSRSEELKRHTIESVQEGVVVFDAGLRCIDWNHAMEVMTGKGRDGLLGKPVDETPLPVTELQPLIARALEGERMSSQDITVPTADGVGRWIMWARFSPLLDEEQKIRGVVGTIADVTARKSLELEVHESEETLRNIIDAMGDALMISDLDGRIWEINRRFTLETGYERSDVLGTTFPYPWVVEEDMTSFVRWVGELGERESLRDHNMRWRRKDGGIIDISISTTMLKDAGQKPVAILSLARDITQRRSMEVEISGLYQAVQDQVGTVTHLYELASDISGVADGAALFGVLHRHIPRSLPAQVIEWYELAPDGTGRLAHSAVAEVSGVTRHADGNAEIDEGVRSLLGSVAASKEPSVAEVGGRSVLGLPVKSAGMVAEAIVLRAPEGRSFTPAHLRLAGSIGSLTAIAMDRIRLYDGLLAKSRQIETRNRELDDFAYVVSHDLKEPLITIEGYAKILTSDYAGRLDEEGVQFLGSISGAVQRMKGMIEDLLTLARVGRTGEEGDVVGLGDVIGEVLQDLEFSIREKKAAVAVQGDMPLVTFDRAQLGIVFRNLLSNALKFNTSADPKVEISARVDPGEVIVSVADNGIGIEQEQHERIFRIFQRVFPRETFDGTGAGLAIVRNIVEHRGGRIWLESKVGEGSTFFFSIPGA